METIRSIQNTAENELYSTKISNKSVCKWVMKRSCGHPVCFFSLTLLSNDDLLTICGSASFAFLLNYLQQLSHLKNWIWHKMRKWLKICLFLNKFHFAEQWLFQVIELEHLSSCKATCRPWCVIHSTIMQFLPCRSPSERHISKINRKHYVLINLWHTTASKCTAGVNQQWTYCSCF